MAREITCYNLNCEHNDVEKDGCVLDSITIGSSGICVMISPEEEQKDAEEPLSTIEEDR